LLLILAPWHCNNRAEKRTAHFKRGVGRNLSDDKKANRAKTHTMTATWCVLESAPYAIALQEYSNYHQAKNRKISKTTIGLKKEIIHQQNHHSGAPGDRAISVKC